MNTEITEEDQRKEAARLLASAGGKAGVGAAKRRSPQHYARLAQIKQVERDIRLFTKAGERGPRIKKLRERLKRLKNGQAD